MAAISSIRAMAAVNSASSSSSSSSSATPPATPAATASHGVAVAGLGCSGVSAAHTIAAGGDSAIITQARDDFNKAYTRILGKEDAITAEDIGELRDLRERIRTAFYAVIAAVKASSTPDQTRVAQIHQLTIDQSKQLKASVEAIEECQGRRSAVVKETAVFNISALHIAIGSWLPLAQVAATRRVNDRWNAYFPKVMQQHMLHRKHMPMEDVRALQKLKGLQPHQWGGLFQDYRCLRDLTTLDLRDSHNLTDAAITDLAARCPGLTSINLSGCYNLTDAAITALAARCPGLTSIDLSGCHNLTDAAITALAARCPGLTSIDLSGCHNLTDAAITALAARCPGLTSIDLSELRSNLTDAAITALAARCPGLTSINLYGCSNLTDAAITALAAKCPGLTSIYLSAAATSQMPLLQLLLQDAPG